MLTLATWLVNLLMVYLAVGIVFAIAFVRKGVEKIDPAAEEGTWGFRVLIAPGAAALWPILAKRWWAGAGPPAESNPHRDAAQEARGSPGEGS